MDKEGIGDQDMPSLAVVILNYNRGDLLVECLRSIYRSPTRCHLDVWVVDNASTDGSAERVQGQFPQVRLLVSVRNGGFAYGNNLALRQIVSAPDGPDLTMLLNNDTVVPEGALDGLVDYLEKHPEVGVVGPKLVLPDGSLDLACRRSFPTPMVSFYRMTGLSRLFPRSRRFGRYNLTYLDPDVETEVDSVVGACMLLRTSVIREVGLLDERFFMYGEDLDWSYRIKQYGWRIVYYPAVQVWHYKRAASSRYARPTTRAFYEAMRLFHRKHFAATTPGPVNTLIEAGITVKEVLALVRHRVPPPAARHRS
jgi:N-acetylglucosaminyl-diphospho-decaprenol L-rhamnosyltransferase